MVCVAELLNVCAAGPSGPSKLSCRQGFRLCADGHGLQPMQPPPPTFVGPTSSPRNRNLYDGVGHTCKLQVGDLLKSRINIHSTLLPACAIKTWPLSPVLLLRSVPCGFTAGLYQKCLWTADVSGTCPARCKQRCQNADLSMHTLS